jgi:hypothetical protein
MVKLAVCNHKLMGAPKEAEELYSLSSASFRFVGQLGKVNWMTTDLRFVEELDRDADRAGELAHRGGERRRREEWV